MASVRLVIEDDSGNEAYINRTDNDRALFDPTIKGVDRLLKDVYADARKIYPEEEND